MSKIFSVNCEALNREVWEEREYRFTKTPSLARSDFEEIAKTFVGWSDEVKMEIEFEYMLHDSVCYVLVRERIQ